MHSSIAILYCTGMQYSYEYHSFRNEWISQKFGQSRMNEFRNQKSEIKFLFSNQSLSDHESVSWSEICRISILLNCGRWSSRARTCRRRCWRSRSGRTPARTCCATAHAQRTSPDSPWSLLQGSPIAAGLCLPRSARTRVHWRASTSVSSRSSCSPSSHLYGELNEDLSARPRSRKRGAGGRARCTDSTALSPPRRGRTRWSAQKRHFWADHRVRPPRVRPWVRAYGTRLACADLTIQTCIHLFARGGTIWMPVQVMLHAP